MPIYEITSFSGALSDFEDRGIKGAFKFGKNLDIRKKRDTLTCNQALEEVGSGTFVDLVRFFVKCSDGNTYGFGSTGKVYKITPSLVVTVVYTAASEIKGAAEWYSDAGKTYLYFATDTGLHRKEIPGASNWSDVNADGGWPKTNLNSADWHTMREAGGSLIIANGPWLALVGYDSSYTNEALDLIPGNLAKTIVERNGRTIVGTVRKDDPSKGINAAIDAEVPLAQIGNDGELFFANMSDSIPAKRFPGGGSVNPGGVTNLIEQANFFEWDQDAPTWIDKQAVGNLSLWGVYDADTGYGGVYSYGRLEKNHPFVLNLDYALDVDEIGALSSTAGITLISYQSGATFGVKAVDLDAKATATYEGLDFKAPVKKPINITTWKTAEIFLDPLPSGASIEFWYRLNKTGSFVQAYVADGDLTYDTANGTKAVFRIAAEGEVFEPRVVLNPTGNSTPEIHRIRIYFA